MTIKQVLDKYKNHHWVQEDANLSRYLFDEWCTCYVQLNKVFKKDRLFSFCFFYGEKDNFYEWSSEEEAKTALQWAVDKYLTDKKFWLDRDREYKRINKEIDKIFYFFRDNDIEGLSNKEFKKYRNYLMRLGNKQFGYNLVSEVMDVVDENYYRNLLPKVNKKELLSVINLLSTPDYVGFLEREHIDILKIAEKYTKKKKSDLNEDIGKHQKKYFWIQNNYQEAKTLSTKYFLNELNSILKNKESNKTDKKTDLAKQRRILYKKYGISKEAKKFFALLRLLAGWQDRRKENVQKIISALDKILDVISGRFGINKKILREYFGYEIDDLLLTGKKVSKRDLIKRDKILFYAYLDKNNIIKRDIFIGKQVLQAKKYFQKHMVDTHKELKGFVASHPKNMDTIKGKVRIVLNANKDKFNKGEILVTGMTRPEFVPLMKQAKAVITNEGGITSHAAIISRELNIPCIIGTKMATKILKNEEIITMNLKTGIINR